MTVLQSTPRKDGYKQAAVARRLIAASKIHPSVLNSTIFVPGLSGETGEVKHLRAGRTFTVNNLRVEKGQMCILVQSQCAPGRWFVCHAGQWSTQDARVIAKCRAAILAADTKPVATYIENGVVEHEVVCTAGRITNWVTMPVQREEW